MSGFSSSKDELLVSLQSYTSLLISRNEALTRLSQSSTEVCNLLKSGTEIGDILKRRQQACEGIAGLSRPDDSSIIEAARHVANAGDDLGRLARTVLALREDSRTLAEEVLACQTECESILKMRIEKLGKALRESSQKRKLNAAYGPTIRVQTPAFLDKQS